MDESEEPSARVSDRAEGAQERAEGAQEHAEDTQKMAEDAQEHAEDAPERGEGAQDHAEDMSEDDTSSIRPNAVRYARRGNTRRFACLLDQRDSMWSTEGNTTRAAHGGTETGDTINGSRNSDQNPYDTVTVTESSEYENAAGVVYTPGQTNDWEMVEVVESVVEVVKSEAGLSIPSDTALSVARDGSTVPDDDDPESLEEGADDQTPEFRTYRLQGHPRSASREYEDESEYRSIGEDYEDGREDSEASTPAGDGTFSPSSQRRPRTHNSQFSDRSIPPIEYSRSPAQQPEVLEVIETTAHALAVSEARLCTLCGTSGVLAEFDTLSSFIPLNSTQLQLDNPLARFALTTSSQQPFIVVSDFRQLSIFSREGNHLCSVETGDTITDLVTHSNTVYVISQTMVYSYVLHSDDDCVNFALPRSDNGRIALFDNCLYLTREYEGLVKRIDLLTSGFTLPSDFFKGISEHFYRNCRIF